MSRSPSPFLVLVAGWLLPGGGHLLLGRRTQAIVFFVAITATFVFGMYLTDFTNVSPERHRYYFVAHVLNGAETAVATILTKNRELAEVPHHFGRATADIGALYTAVACLLNLIVAMNAMGVLIEAGEEAAVARLAARVEKREARDTTPEEELA